MRKKVVVPHTPPNKKNGMEERPEVYDNSDDYDIAVCFPSVFGRSPQLFKQRGEENNVFFLSI